MRILVYGAGVIGCELAHELCKGENDVTLLARGSWKDTIDQKGLVIRHYGQLRTTVDQIKTVSTLEKDDTYDLIFVVMQYSQIPHILERLIVSTSSYIVMVGNNMTPYEYREQIYKESVVPKEVAFGFQGIGGRREKDRVISMHFNLAMTIGGLREALSTEFQRRILEAFKGTGYKLKWENHMEGWLLSHAAHILPTAYLCYSLNCNLMRATRKQVDAAVRATGEAHKMLKKMGYPIRPDGEEEAYSVSYKKAQRHLYLLVKTPAGKYVISTHCSNAVGEMLALDHEFEVLRNRADIEMPMWDRLHKKAMENYKK